MKTPERTILLDKLSELLVERGLKMATAESCTGGGIASACTDLAGSSQWFDCGLVTYSNEAKQTYLGVPEDTLIQWGAVSEQTVIAMVEGAVSRSEAHVALAVSGIAGPGGGSKDKPVGTVWFAWGDGSNIESQRVLFEGDRMAVRAGAIDVALAGLLSWLDSGSGT